MKNGTKEENLQHIKAANWSVRWKITESTGLAIYLADYRGKRVVWEAALPYVTIDHQRQELDIDKEARPSHGPFWMPLGERCLASEVRENHYSGGFELAADFAAGPYRYTQLWRFQEDGRMAPWLTIHGGGLHDGHTYHPHWRLDFDIKGSIRDRVEYFEDGRWNKVEEECWLPFTGQADGKGNAWRQVGGQGGYVNIRPNSWEDAELFAVRYQDGEGAPFTPKSSSSVSQLPANAGSAPLAGDDITLWYAAHVHFDHAFPFTAGPWIQCQGF